MDTYIIAKLQRHGGYQGWRVRPYPLNTTLWLAETYTQDFTVTRTNAPRRRLIPMLHC
jgi:hypothetical protein